MTPTHSTSRLAPLGVALSLALAAAPAGASEAHDAHGAAAGPAADRALSELKAGNARFVSGRLTRRHVDRKRVKEVSTGQHPKAIVLGCADSRVPPEVVFDEGIGDVFVVRVAGNVSEPATLASVEYAAEHLHVPLIIVLGHERCGAVKATAETKEPVEGNIGKLLKELQPPVDAARKHPGKRGLVDDAVHVNVEYVAEQLKIESPVLAGMVEKGEVRIVTGVYKIETGEVEWGD